MKTILLIEDNTELRDNIGEMLEIAGYKVIFAINGKSGIALAKENKPDIIICDILMPDVDGFEVIRILKQNPITAGMPFIFLTSRAEKEIDEGNLEIAADGYIRKPFDTKDLFSTVERCLNK